MCKCDSYSHVIMLGYLMLAFTIIRTDGSTFQPIMDTTKGKVRGVRVTVRGNDVDMFLGIPFAKPPLGELRFKHPYPNDAWIGVLKATERPPACWQTVDAIFDNYTNFSGSAVWNPNTERSEDCLYLNVWVPKPRYDSFSDSSRNGKSVMVWIFGGGFFSGSSSLEIYDGRYIAAENDIIVVSMQYRLGPLGFLALYHREAPGNAGMFDQVMALDWVQQNIHFFGGNPHSVTLFGESAGAVSVGMHMLSPLSRGKFHQVILQSGAPHAAWAVLTDRIAKNRSMILAEKLRCNNGDVLDIIDCLRGKTPKEFVDAEYGTIPYGVVRFPFVPIVDGAFLTDMPEKLLSTHNFKKCPILLGHNTNEANYWLLYYEPKIFPLYSEPELSQNHFNLLIDDLFNYHPYYPIILNSFGKEAIKFQYRNWINPEDQKQNVVNIDKAVGDFHFTCPVVDFAIHAASVGSKVFYYVFDHRSSVHQYGEWTGVLHADEINFVFGEPLNHSKKYSKEEEIFSKKIMKYWTNFAKSGDPNKTPGEVFSNEWPMFNNATRQHLILKPEFINVLEKSKAIGQGERAKECAFWKDYLPNLVVKTADMSELEVEWKMQFNEWSTKYIVDWKRQFDSFLLEHGLNKQRNCPTS